MYGFVAVLFPRIIEHLGLIELLRECAEHLFADLVVVNEFVTDEIERSDSGIVSFFFVARECFCAYIDAVPQIVEAGRKEMLPECGL